jgi:hypothetical protein
VKPRKTYSPVCELVKLPNKRQETPKFRDVISQTMVYHLLYHFLSNSAKKLRPHLLARAAAICLILLCV